MSESLNNQIMLFDKAIEAIINGDASTLQKIIDDNLGIVQQYSQAEHQASLLHYVSANGVEDDKQKTPDNVVEIAKILLEAGANPNQVSNIYGGGNGSTAMVALVSSSHPAQAGKMGDLVRLFCQYANPDGVDNEQYPLATAISFRYSEAITALVESGATIDNIISASAIGNLEMVKTLFHQDLPSYINSFGMITESQKELRELALSAACMMGHLEIVQFLVEQDVDIDAKSSIEGGSALVEASINNRIEVVKYLLTQNVDIASQDNQGFTALHWATWHGYLELAKLLLEHNAPLEILNTYGGTVIYTAVHGFVHGYYPVTNQLEILQTLIDAGADVSRINPYPTGNQVIDEFLKPYKKQ